MSYLFDKILNESYLYETYNDIDIGDPVEFSRISSECITEHFQYIANLNKIETNNVCALIEAKSFGDNSRINQLSYVMEGFFTGILQGVINFVKKIIKMIINFFKKLFGHSSSSGGGGGSSTATRPEDGKPIIEEKQKHKVMVNITYYPIDFMFNVLDDIAVEGLDNIFKFKDIISEYFTSKSRHGQVLDDLFKMPANDFIKKNLKDKYDYLRQDVSYFPMFAYQLYKKHPNYGMKTIDIDEFKTDMPISTYNSFVSSKFDTVKKGLNEYEDRVSKFNKELSNVKMDFRIRKYSNIHTVDDNYYDNDDREDEDNYIPDSSVGNQDDDADPEYDKLNNLSYDDTHYDLFRRNLLEIRPHMSENEIMKSYRNMQRKKYNYIHNIKEAYDMSSGDDQYQFFIDVTQSVIRKTTIMMQKVSIVLGDIIKKDQQQYATIYNKKQSLKSIKNEKVDDFYDNFDSYESWNIRGYY